MPQEYRRYGDDIQDLTVDPVHRIEHLLRYGDRVDWDGSPIDWHDYNRGEVRIPGALAMQLANQLDALMDIAYRLNEDWDAVLKYNRYNEKDSEYPEGWPVK